MGVDNDYEDDITDLLGEVQRASDARQQVMSLSTLYKTFKRVHDLKATLGEEINARAAVNQLPNELILEIFKQVLAHVDPCTTIALDASETARVQTGPLLSFTHICRRWRRVALAHAVLWQRIDCHDPEQLQEFALHRSYPAPFSLFIDVSKYYASGDKAALRSVLTDSDRLRRLDMAYGLTREPVLYSRLLDLSCPNLECLTVSKYPPAAMYTHTEPPVIVSRKSLFCGGLSRLRALAISPIADWLPANPLPALTHLYLSFLWNTDLCMTFILSVLGGAPALEVLHLSGFILPHEDGHLVPSVSLDRLKYILFTKKSYLRPALALLSQLVIPRSTRINLDCVNVNSKAPTSILPRLPSTVVTERLAVHTECGKLQVAAQGSNSGFWLYGRESSDTAHDRFATWLPHLPTMFPLSHLTHLQLRLDSPGSTGLQVLRETISLTTLEVGISLYLDEEPDDGGEDALVCVSRALSEGRGSIEPVPYICPGLRVLTLVLDSDSLTPQSSYTRWLDTIRYMLIAQCAGIYDDRVAFMDEDLAEYDSLFEYVEDFTLHRSGEDPVSFPDPGQDLDEVERYWTIAEEDRPSFDHQ